MKIFSLFLLSLLNLSVFANEGTISETPYNFAKIYIGHGQPYFLEIGSDHCPSCITMGKTLYTVKKENPQYNIMYINVGNDRTTAQQLKVQMIPTQIIYDAHGKEVYRHVGKLDEIELDEIFEKYNFNKI